ncbi:MAG TPA: hypothetical protein VMI31_18245 [Fimbriimonadaceae bacterium]|nr:hypothetical protein [Fimbriimonadaceae bacterium]
MFSVLAASVLLPGPKTLTEHIALASLFKNGYCVVLREMDVSGSGEYMLNQIPQASLGTLWFTTSDGVKLTSVVNTEVPKSDDVKAQSISDLLNLNVGKHVTLYFLGQDAVTGVLMSAAGSNLIVKSGEQTIVVDKTSVVRVASPDTLTDSSSVKSTTRGFRFEVQSPGAGKIYMLSLERGMSWSPAYAVTLKDGKKLEVVGKSTVVNDLEDLNSVETRFITGWPNIPYAYISDPLSDAALYQNAVANLPSGGARQAVPNRGGGFGGGGFGGQAASPFTNQAPNVNDLGQAMPTGELGGEQAEDLFFYRQPNVTLKKGDRGYFIVMTMDAPYDEVYTWDIDDFVQDAQYRPVPPEAEQEDVWHTIRFTNESKQPFSTGAATIFKDGQIIGQDLMKYVSVGGKGELNITKAMDVSADQLEEEVSRERGVLRNTYNQSTHDLVTLKGTLTMVNRKPEAVTVRVRKSLTGEVISTSPEAKVTKTARGLRDVNSRAQLEWNEKIEPGKTLTMTYTYKVYIRVS